MTRILLSNAMAILLLWAGSLSFVAASEETQLRKRVPEDRAPVLELEPIKIARCFGDCDSSDNCEEGLVCYHRDLDDADDSVPVPGCSESDNADIHTTNSVCVTPDNLPQHAVSRTAPVRRNLLSLCRGDCDSDSDCNGNLVCQQRDRGQSVQGCSGKDLSTSRDYCVLPSSSSNSLNVINSGGGGMGRCQGDCDSDNDCAGSLVCKQRNAYDPIPSGCRGNLSWKTDYCVTSSSSGGSDNNGNSNGSSNNNGNSNGNNNSNNNDGGDDDNSPSTSSSSSFRLKIYWEEGYDWQDEYFERKWCLTRDNNVGGTCWHGLDRETCRGDRLYVTKCSGSSRQEFNFEYVNREEALIKVTGQDRCLHRSGVDISLRSCSPDSSAQRFFAPRGGFKERRFELSQKSASKYCLNQDHHPKNNEYVQMFPCTWTRARDSLTSYWERY